MSIFGSSSLQYTFTFLGVTGPTGPTGPTGATGITGPLIAGVTGITGFGITGVTSAVAYNLTMQIQGTGSVSINIRGQSGAIVERFALIRGVCNNLVYPLYGNSIIYTDDVGEFSENFQIIQSDEYIRLKGLTFKSETNSFFSVTTDANYLSMVGITQNFNRAGDTGNIVYQYALNKAKGVENSYWYAGISMLDIPLSSERHAVYDSKNYDIRGLNFSQNILGYTGSTGIMVPFHDFTPDMAFDVNTSRYKVDFDINSNIKLVQTSNIGTTGATNLSVSFLPVTFNRGTSFTPQLINAQTLGSCCFCELDEAAGDIKCVDYVSKTYCDSMGGNFNTNGCSGRVINGDCFAEGACCVNGKCLNTSEQNCTKYGGIFHPNRVCNPVDGGEEEYFVCTDYCGNATETGKCCVNGRCFDNFTRFECDSLPNSSFHPNEVCSGECDPTCEALSRGGCCRNGVITPNIRPQDCSDGLFLGPGVNSGRCCGKDVNTEYFNTEIDCRITQNIPCLPIGTKIGGGYLVGIVGHPSPCTSFNTPLVAEGQVLACRYYPRGFVTGDETLTWKYKNCIGESGQTLEVDSNIKYFARTHPVNLTRTNLDNKCLFKGGIPYVMQTFEGVARTTETTSTPVEWPDSIMFNTPTTRGTFAYSHEDISTVTLFEGLGLANSDLYRKLANQFYADNGIPVLWALIVYPSDISVFSSTLLRWGMSEGRVRNVGPSRYNTEPVSTCPLDGLLTTRIHDESSKENTYFWFRPDTTGGDPKAYDRFAFYTGSSSNISKWPAGTNETIIESNQAEFKIRYGQMWDANNSSDSCTKQISILNQNGLQGYSDWYIPSIIELNYMFANRNELNNAMLISGDYAFDEESSYWSSTSMCSLFSWRNTSPNDREFYTITEQPSGNFNSKFRFTQQDFNVSQVELYDLSMNVCAGETMLVQDFSDGFVHSESRDQKTASLRPVRRIPIIKVACNQDYSIVNAYASYDLVNCPSCPDGC